MAELTTLPAEIWANIIEYLGSWDALQIRQTCTLINENIIACQTYWYRHFTWFLIKQNKRVALFKTACKRYHKDDIKVGVNCLSVQQEEALSVALAVPISKLGESGVVTADVLSKAGISCGNPQHYIYDLPESRHQIPIHPSDYHPKKQLYIYRFLIHNYRHRRDKVKRFNIDDVTLDIKRMERHVAKLLIDTERARRQLEMLKEAAAELKIVRKNDVFFGTKSRQYKVTE
jgi:hypothetical protein